MQLRLSAPDAEFVLCRSSERESRMVGALRFHGVPERLLWRIADAAAESERLDDAGALASGLESVLGFAPWTSLRRTQPLLLVGPPGAGKTVLAAKIAALLARSRVLLVNADADRAASTAQLAEYAGILGIRLAAAASVRNVRTALLRNPTAPAVIDTPGVDPEDRVALRRLAEIAGAVRATIVLVLPAGIEVEEGERHALGFAALGASRLVSTRLDLTRRLGGVIAGAAAARLPFAGASFAPHFAYGLRPLAAPALARRLLVTALDESRRTSPALARIGALS